jgi:hypothetical protein
MCSSVEPRTNSPGVEQERLVVGHLDELGEVVLLLGRVDVGVAVVGEDPEEAVEPHVDAARLDHRLVVGRQRHPAGRQARLEVTVREQHGPAG